MKTRSGRAPGLGGRHCATGQVEVTTVDESFAARRSFVIKENAVARVESIFLTAVHRDPVGVELRHRLWTAWITGAVSFCGVSWTKPQSSNVEAW